MTTDSSTEASASSVFDKQKRGRVIALNQQELDEFLGQQRTCRMATVNKYGKPHVTALWFVWDGGAVWINSVVKSRRWADFEQRPDVSILVDDGHDYNDLRGAELIGKVEIVEPFDDRELCEKFAQKYMPGGSYEQDQYHRWIKLVPTKVVSWDFRKLPADRKR